MLATEGLLLDHVPPVLAFVRLIDDPKQTLLEPLMAAGAGLIVTIVVAVQPPGNVYVIVAVPPEFPSKTPVVEPIDATIGLELPHVPPPEVFAKVVELPGQSTKVPVIAPGTGLTVTACVAKQLPGSVYVITGVPIALPVTIPVAEPTEPRLGLLLVHTPPPNALLRVVVAPRQTNVAPEMADGV